MAVPVSTDTGMELMYEDDAYDNTIPDIQKVTKKNNILQLWGNQKTMNLNGLVLENIIQCTYYKNVLADYSTFQQLVDETYYSVKHLEPWEKGTRKTQGMTGMCGGVRGVGAGGVVSSAYCLLYKFFTMRITRKQLVSMINSNNSPYLRGIGFMYIRYCQPPSDLYAWFEPYLDDEDSVDCRSGGGEVMSFGQIVRIMMNKLDWYGTLFPRIPVPIQKEIQQKLHEYSQAVIDQERQEWDRVHRKRAAPRGGDEERRNEEKRPKIKSRCKHHLRHHHCRKHRKECPHKSKAIHAAKEEEQKRKEEEEKAKEQERIVDAEKEKEGKEVGKEAEKEEEGKATE